MEDKLVHGDSIEVLKTLGSDSVDLLATDPPYGYSFMGKSWDKALPSIEIFKECFRVLKPGAFAFVMSAPRSDVCSRMAILLEDAGFNIAFTPIYWTYASGFPKAMNIGKAIDRREGVEREIVGPSTRHSGTPENSPYHATGITERVPMQTRATSDAAKTLDGSYAGFQPKPAVEVVIVAMKPLSEKTYVEQSLHNGKGVTWLDSVRIPAEESTERPNGRAGKQYLGGYAGVGIGGSNNGRFPSNLIVSDDILNDGTITISRNGGFSGSNANPMSWSEENKSRVRRAPNDSGGYSRFFSLDAWAQTLPFLVVRKAAKREKGTDNKHPTVKPIKLMSYLITLGSREGDVVLDPFLGSGTTAIAAKELGRRYIGIEKEKEYYEIAEARLIATPRNN